ncbi:glutathione ABC transporter substrate-binding protein [Paenibacillus frigoriresistens]|uniref:glutathione ABC transporter substrate-binding protein n=1 Tax=Paenibacillus alginolyticus TaxID=59839 RepID=UPI0015642A5F|nr:glutathione ABC transporter substrate-binding protein [Paenibacillus frigoriresistens]NRF93345.1 glutathione ABC transporter substrate-binding protein [Paenibacillus frigoriresistens]
MRKISFIVFLCTMLVLSACSSSSKSSGTENQAAVEPKDLVVALGAEPTILDPQDSNDALSNNATELLFDKLVTLDKEGKIVPQLAKEWSTSTDGKKMTFKLREGVKFQDDTPLNAEAVKFTFDRVLNKENKLNRYSFYSEFIDKVNADSEYQVSFDLKFPFGPALTYFAQAAGAIHSPKNLKEQGKNIGKAPVGAGPFKLKEWVPGTKVVFEANPNYWAGKPKVKTITFKPVPENASRSIMLETGEADVISPVVPTDVERLKGNDKVNVLVSPSSRTLEFPLNTTKAPFNDVRVRQALNYAVDKETIVKKVLSGYGKVSEAAIAESIVGYSSVGVYPYDPEKAKQLLAEAGVKPGTKIMLWTPEGRYLMDRQIAEFVQGNLQAVGFTVEFRKYEWGTYKGLTTNPKKDGYDVIMDSWGASTGDADWAARPNFATTGSNNLSGITNADLDALLDKGMKTANPDERKKIYSDALKIVKEQAPWIFVLDNKQITGVRKNVEGVYNWTNERLILRDAVKK